MTSSLITLSEIVAKRVYFSLKLHHLILFITDVEKIFDSPFFSELILYWLANMGNTSNSGKVLILEVATILVKNELHFNKLQQMQRFDDIALKLFDVMRASIPSVYISGLKLFTAQISHYTGLSWVIQHKIWTHIFLPDLHTFPETVVSACCRYIEKLTWKLNEYGEDIAVAEVLQFILEPIETQKCEHVLKCKVIDVQAEKYKYEPMVPNLQVLLMILNDTELGQPNKVMKFFLTRIDLMKSPFQVMIELSRDPDLVLLLYHIFIRLKLQVILEPKFNEARPKDANDIITLYYNTIHYLIIGKNLLPATLDFFRQNIMFWSKVKNIEFERYGRTFEIRNQFMMLLLNPLIVICYEEFSKRDDKIQLEHLDLYYNKIVDMTTEHIVKVGYSFKAAMMACSNRKKIIIETMKQLMMLKGHLSGTQAGIVYQALFYVLGIYVASENRGNLPVILTDSDDVKLLSMTLDMMTLLLKEHNINWYETLEIICLQKILIALLAQNRLSITVSSFNVLLLHYTNIKYNNT